MSTAAVKEEVGDGIAGRLGGKLQGVAVAGGKVVVDGEGAEIGIGLGGGDLTREVGNAWIERLGELEITVE
jgi:hypothetical protein